jgi:hypothetical protein
MQVLGGCVGHNCRIGSGHIFFPGRSIESDVVLFAQQGRTVMNKNITYADSDHHDYPDADHRVMYHDEVPPEGDSEKNTTSTEALVESIS